MSAKISVGRILTVGMISTNYDGLKYAFRGIIL